MYLNPDLLITCRPYCLPEAWTYKFVEGINAYDRPAGMLFVTVKEATNVPQMDWFNPSDPYVM